MSSRIEMLCSKGFWKLLLPALASLFIMLAIVQLHGAIASKDYEKVPGYISDVTYETVYRRRGPVREYTYTVHWFYEGEEYTKKFVALDKPDEDLSYVRINEDNTDIIPGSLKGQYSGALMCFGVAAVAAVGWFILLWTDRKKVRTKDDWENIYIGSWLAIFLMPFGIFFSYIGMTHEKASTADYAMRGLLILFSLAEILAIILNRVSKKRK